MTNITLKTEWKKLENKSSPPQRARKVIEVNYEDFKNEIFNEKPDFVKKITESLYSGDFYILKGAYTEKFMKNLKEQTFSYFKNKPCEFHKMLEGCPDFHRKIDFEITKKYAVKMCKHSFYFYPWNSDPLKIFEPINKRWRVIKKLMGLEPNTFENNTPKDGVVDRIQVVQYPSKIGYFEPHTDPYKFQRLILSAFMSKKGVDFEGIGFYLLDSNNNIIEVEDQIDIGDIGIGYATVYHGVAPVNLSKEPNWNDMNDGRWFLSTYSNQSDKYQTRHTSAGKTDNIKINDNLRSRLIPPNAES